jgi:hypothetical protein
MEKQSIETNVIKPKLSIFVNEVEHRLISKESEESLDKRLSDIATYMATNVGFGKEESVKDELYANAKQLWTNYAEELRDTKYTFYLNRKQYNFLTDLLIDKLEYDVNTIFLAIELTNMLGSWSNKEDKYKDDVELKGFTSDATEVTYMYHLIAKHKVKGLKSSSYLFAEVLRKIGDISKIISYYDTGAKNMSKEIQEWVAKFEPQEEAPKEETKEKAKKSVNKNKKVEENA